MKKKESGKIWEANVVTICILLVAVLSLATFILHFFSPEATVLIQQLSYYIFAYAVFIGFSAVIKKNSHIKLDVLSSKYPEKARKIIDAAMDAAVALVCVVILITSLIKFFEAMQTGKLNAQAAIPVALVYAAPVIGMGSALVRYFQRILFHDKEEKK